MLVTDHGAYTKGRDALAARYMAMLRAVPRGHVLAWQACGCIVAAESLAQGLAAWHASTYGVKAFGLSGTDGSGQAYGFI